MKKYTLYVGLNDKETKVQTINTLEAYKIVTNILNKEVDGATVFEADGIYKHENGTFVVEKTFRIELLTATLEAVKKIVDQLKTVLNQESIAVQEQDIISNLW